MMNSGEIASAEIFIRPVIFDIFLNQINVHRAVKILSYKVIYQLCSFFDIIEILRMEDEPNIG